MFTLAASIFININTFKATWKMLSQSKRMLSKVKSISSYKSKHDLPQQSPLVPAPHFLNLVIQDSCVEVKMPRRELPPTDKFSFNSPPSDDKMVSSPGVIILSLGSVAVEEAAEEAAAASMVVLAKVESADAR